MSRLNSTSIAIPHPLRDWAKAEAARLDMNLSQYLVSLLQAGQQFQMHERLARLEARMTAFESAIPTTPETET